MTLDLFKGRADIWRGSLTPPKNTQTTPTGFTLLNQKLVNGGWPKGAITEILCGDDGTPPLWLVMPALAALSRESAWITWVAPPFTPYAPALQSMGLRLSRILLVHPRKRNSEKNVNKKNASDRHSNYSYSDQCWALEQALKSGTTSAVLGWLNNDNPKVLRRLQLAAEAGKTTGFIFRPKRYAQQQSNAALRLYVELHPRGLLVKIIKCRGGWTNNDKPIRILFDQLPTYPVGVSLHTEADIASPEQNAVSRLKTPEKTDTSQQTLFQNYTDPQPYVVKKQRNMFNMGSNQTISSRPLIDTRKNNARSKTGHDTNGTPKPLSNGLDTILDLFADHKESN